MIRSPPRGHPRVPNPFAVDFRDIEAKRGDSKRCVFVFRKNVFCKQKVSFVSWIPIIIPFMVDSLCVFCAKGAKITARMVTRGGVGRFCFRRRFVRNGRQKRRKTRRKRTFLKPSFRRNESSFQRLKKVLQAMGLSSILLKRFRACLGL